MNAGRRPGGIERGRLDFVLGSWFSKIRILARIHKRIVSGHGLLQSHGRHRLLLIFANDLARELGKRGRTEKPALRIHVWRRTRPTLSSNRVCIEDRPNGASSFACSTIQLQARIPPIESGGCFVYEPQTHLIHVDHVLVVPYEKAYGTSEARNRAILQIFVASPTALRITILITNHVGFFKNVRSGHCLKGLVRYAPKCCPDAHSRALAITSLA